MFDEGEDLTRAALPENQITLPVARHRTIRASVDRSEIPTMPVILACFGRVDPRGRRSTRPERNASFNCVCSSPHACTNNV